METMRGPPPPIPSPDFIDLPGFRIRVGNKVVGTAIRNSAGDQVSDLGLRKPLRPADMDQDTRPLAPGQPMGGPIVATVASFNQDLHLPAHKAMHLLLGD